jgi:hypothetical protein
MQHQIDQFKEATTPLEIRQAGMILLQTLRKNPRLHNQAEAIQMMLQQPDTVLVEMVREGVRDAIIVGLRKRLNIPSVSARKDADTTTFTESNTQTF